MTTFKAHFDGKIIIPDEQVNLPINQPLQMSATSIPTPDAKQIAEQLKEFEELLQLSDHANGSADWSRDSIYSGTLDDPR
jgi:hypothetical protein